MRFDVAILKRVQLPVEIGLDLPELLFYGLHDIKIEQTEYCTKNRPRCHIWDA